MEETKLKHNTITPYASQETKKQQVEEMFDNIAPSYDFLNHVLSLKIDVRWRNKLVRWLKKDQPRNVLDVATGTGDLAVVVQKGTGAQVTGFDLSRKMLDVAVKKVESLGLSDKIRMVKGDAEKLPFADDEFDAITVAFGVRNFENLQAGLSEMKRVVRSEGSVYILEFSRVENRVLRAFYDFYFKYVLPGIGRLVSKDKRAYTYLHDSASAFPYGEKMKNILLQVGYHKVEYKKLTFGIATIYRATK